MSFLRLSAIAFLFLHGTVSCFQMSMESTSKNSFSASLDSSRRGFFATSSKMAPTFLSLVGISTINPSLAIAAGGASKESLLSDLQTSRAKMEKIPSLLQNGEWDAVRTILKTPPLNKLWNLGESQNTLVQLAKETGDFELLELKDELAISLQMCDQLTYDNAFVYFQPGNGKVKIKEPTSLAVKAMSQIQEAIDTVNAN